MPHAPVGYGHGAEDGGVACGVECIQIRFLIATTPLLRGGGGAIPMVLLRETEHGAREPEIAVQLRG